MARSLELLSSTMLVFSPLLYWAGDEWGGHRIVGCGALILVAGLVLVGLNDRSRPTIWYARLAAPLAIIFVAFVLDWRELLFGLPIAISLLFLALFAWSLAPGKVPVVERIARAIDGELSAEKVAYCRIVTLVWCVFFVVNASIALMLSIYGTLAAWSLYTGVIAYVVMGLLFSAEYVTRRIRFG